MMSMLLKFNTVMLQVRYLTKEAIPAKIKAYLIVFEPFQVQVSSSYLPVFFIAYIQLKFGAFRRLKRHVMHMCTFTDMHYSYAT